jgi:hypothetical protein
MDISNGGDSEENIGHDDDDSHNHGVPDFDEI